MEQYGNASGHSGVTGFALRGEEGIVVRFVGGGCYLYDGSRPGAEHVCTMRERALAGEGLATYISRFVRDRYAARVS